MTRGVSLATTKILRDLWLNRARTILVIVSIALSVMAFGVLNTTRSVILDMYTNAYLQAEPAQVILTLPDFDEKLLEKVRRLPEVRLAEGRRAFDLKIEVQGKLYNITTYASPNPVEARISRLVWDGSAPPSLTKGDVLLDRTIRSLLEVAPGQQISIQTTDGNWHRLNVAGLPNDLVSTPTQYTLTGQAFLRLDTAENLGQRRAYNQMLIITHARGADLAALQADIQRQAERITHELEHAAYPALGVEIPVAGRPPLFNLVNALMLLLQMFGFLIVLITVMVVSVVAGALMAEQTSQVGILKALGNASSGVLNTYSRMVFIIGGSALLIALPLIWWVSRWGVNMVAGQIDTPVQAFHLPLTTWVGVPLLAFGATFAAVFRPLWRTSRLSIRQAISEETQLPAGRAVLNVGSMLIRSSLRTLLRKRQRLFLNLLMLSLAGAMFATALNIRQEIQQVGARIQQRNNFDLFVGLSETVKQHALESTAATVPGVREAQAYLSGSIGRVLPDGALTGSVPVIAVPASSDYHRVALVSGQWPLPENGIVLSTEALEIWNLAGDPPPAIGTPLRVYVAGHQADWVLSGIMGKVTRPVAYVSYDSYAALTRQVGMANMIAVRLQPGVSSLQISNQLPAALQQVGYSVLYSDEVSHSNAAQMAAFNIPVYALLGIVALIALVGGLGLSSTLSISVMERRREIGILRSMGAEPDTIRRLILTEGLLIALLSLPFAWLLAWPLTLAMGQIVVVATIGFIPPLIYLPGPALAWSALVCVLALISSWMPARQASRLSIRETLIYTG